MRVAHQAADVRKVGHQGGFRAKHLSIEGEQRTLELAVASFDELLDDVWLVVDDLDVVVDLEGQIDLSAHLLSVQRRPSEEMSTCSLGSC